MPGPATRRVAAKKLSDFEADIMTLYDLKPGSLRRRAGETKDQLLDRIERDAGDVLLIAEGSVPVLCAVFDQPQDIIETLIAASDSLQEALFKGQDIARLRLEESRDAAVALKEFMRRKLKEEHRRITHDENWPEDPEAFHLELSAILPEALFDYNGSVIQMSAPLHVTIPEIESIIKDSPRLKRLQTIYMTKEDSLAEVNFAEKAATGPAAGAYRFLVNRQPEKYSDKQQIDLKTSGFAPPPKDFGQHNVLFRKKDKESEK